MPHKFLGSIFIQGKKILVMEDRSEQHNIVSITNTVESICSHIESEGILYMDSSGVWDAWLPEFGFIALGAAQRHIAEDSLEESIISLRILGMLEDPDLDDMNNDYNVDDQDHNQDLIDELQNKEGI